MYQVLLKTWADGRLRFLQVRKSGKVVFGVIFDASSDNQWRLVNTFAGAIASCFALSVNEVKDALQDRS